VRKVIFTAVMKPHRLAVNTLHLYNPHPTFFLGIKIISVLAELFQPSENPSARMKQWFADNIILDISLELVEPYQLSCVDIHYTNIDFVGVKASQGLVRAEETLVCICFDVFQPFLRGWIGFTLFDQAAPG
jgi:hypothetical protein